MVPSPLLILMVPAQNKGELSERLKMVMMRILAIAFLSFPHQVIITKTEDEKNTFQVVGYGIVGGQTNSCFFLNLKLPVLFYWGIYIFGLQCCSTYQQRRRIREGLWVNLLMTKSNEPNSIFKGGFVKWKKMKHNKVEINKKVACIYLIFFKEMHIISTIWPFHQQKNAF